MNAKRYVWLYFVLISIGLVHAQRTTPIQWEIVPIKKTSVGETVVLLFKANIQPLWYLYSNNKKGNTHKNSSFWFYNNNNKFKIIEKPEAIYEIEYFNRKINQKEYIIEEEGGFAQKIKVLKPNPIIKGQINYLLCNRGNNQEIPQVYHFEIQLKTKNK
tara:strand:+ start:245 stop:721 length:477 start_codon:yes stop_codon:yes gene_type:complete